MISYVRRFLLGLASFAVIAQVSCSVLRGPSLLDTEQVPADTSISIKNTEYLGQSYTIVIEADGNAATTPTQYNGHGQPNVPQKIPFKRQLTREQLVEVIREFEKANFFGLRDQYRSGDAECPNQPTDGREKVVTITIKGQTKSVVWENCYQNEQLVPTQLSRVIEKIEAAVDFKQSF